MGASTKIQYADSTVNPTSGCDGCELWNGKVKTCYAGTLHTRFAGKNAGFPAPFSEIHIHPGRMAKAAKLPDLRGKVRADKPWLNGLPRIIFIGDMTDTFSYYKPHGTVQKAIPGLDHGRGRATRYEYPRAYLITEVIGNVTSPAGRRHFWLWFTKRPHLLVDLKERLDKEGMEWPPNLMPVTTVTCGATASRAKALSQIDSVPWGLSFEPLLAPGQDTGTLLPELISYPVTGRPSWVAIGGESGPSARPTSGDDIRFVLATCRAYGVPVFVKQLGYRFSDDHSGVVGRGGERPSAVRRLVDPHGGDISEWPPRFQVREMPIDERSRACEAGHLAPAEPGHAYDDAEHEPPTAESLGANDTCSNEMGWSKDFHDAAFS